MRHLILPALLIISITSVFAQPNPEERRQKMKERMDAMKIAFITDALDLTSAEAEKFWPVFNEFQKEIDVVRSKGFKGGPHPPDIENMSDQEVSKMLEEEIIIEQQILDIKKKYLSKFKEVLPVKKVAKLLNAEREFKRKVLEEFKKRREGGGDFRNKDKSY